MTPALKEWSAAVHALLDGRQTILLRKGGIGEKRFEVAAQGVPVVPDGRAQPRASGPSRASDLLAAPAADSTDDQMTVRAAAKVVAAVAVNRPERLPEIEDLHIWTAESVRADRLDFRPKHQLAVLVVSAIPLAEPVRLTRTPDYAGCTSWVQLPTMPRLAAPVHDDEALAASRSGSATPSAELGPTGSSSRDRRKCTECVAGLSCRPVSAGSPVPRLRA